MNQQIVQQAIERAIAAGYDAQRVAQFVAKDSLVRQFVVYNMARFSVATLAAYITESLDYIAADDTDSGGADQADWTPMGNLHSLKSSLREGW